MNLGVKINYYRKSKGLMQAELGALLFVTRQTVSLWENGQTMPSIDNIVRLAEIFGITIDELLLGELPSDDKGEKSAAEEKAADCERIIKAEDKEGAEENILDGKPEGEENSREDKDTPAKKDNKLLKFITNKYVLTALLLTAILITLGIIFLTGEEDNKAISDEEIGAAIGTELPRYKSRTVISNAKDNEKIEIFAVTEISFDGDVSGALCLSMYGELPDGIEKNIDSTFLYKNCELYSLFSRDKEKRVSEVSASGSYVFASYDAETKILRVTEFKVK